MIIPEPQLGLVGELLANAATSLDITSEMTAAATESYDAVAEWLTEPGSRLAEHGPHIYPQGSFTLGTMVRPLGDTGCFDIDLVCRLGLTKERTSHVNLKAEVGRRLGESPQLARCLTESRRCWQLVASDDFHLDVLPAIPDSEHGSDTAILLTDTQLRRWQHSDPIAFADWFKRQMAKSFLEKRAELAEREGITIDAVPEWRVRTALQRVIQILKRHRDVRFAADDKRRPVSMIITTLAARAYRGEHGVGEALHGITSRMSSFIERRRDALWVANPVNDAENFADKWNEDPSRGEAFIRWLEAARSDLREAAEGGGLQRVTERLSRAFGGELIKEAAAQYGESLHARRNEGRLLFGGLATGVGAAEGTPVKKHTFFGSSET